MGAVLHPTIPRIKHYNFTTEAQQQQEERSKETVEARKAFMKCRTKRTQCIDGTQIQRTTLYFGCIFTTIETPCSLICLGICLSLANEYQRNAASGCELTYDDCVDALPK